MFWLEVSDCQNLISAKASLKIKKIKKATRLFFFFFFSTAASLLSYGKRKLYPNNQQSYFFLYLWMWPPISPQHSHWSVPVLLWIRDGCQGKSRHVVSQKKKKRGRKLNRQYIILCAQITSFTDGGVSKQSKTAFFHSTMSIEQSAVYGRIMPLRV